MSDDQLAELRLIDHSQAQRQAWAERWPLILANANQFDMAEEFRRALSAAGKPVLQFEAA